MPTLSMFYGIIIRMFFKDHNEPHFHASYQGQNASFDLNGNLIEGQLPAKQRKMVEVWASLHEDELAANWELAQDEGELFRIEPLR